MSDEYVFPRIRYNRANERVQAKRPIETTLNSFYLGGQHAISSGGENIFFKNITTDLQWYPMWGGIRDQEVVANQGANGLIAPSARFYGDELITTEFFQLPHATTVTPYSVTYDPDTESVHNVTVVLGEVLEEGVHVEYHIHNDNELGTTVYSQDITIHNRMEVGETLSLWFDHPHDQNAGEQKLAVFKVRRGHIITPMLVASTRNSSDFYLMNTSHELFSSTQVAVTYRVGTGGDLISAMGGTAILNTDTTQPLAIAEGLIADSGSIVIEYTPSRLYDHNTVFDNTATNDSWESWIYGSGTLAFRIGGTNATFTTGLIANTTYLICYRWSTVGGVVTYQVGVDGAWGVAVTSAWPNAPTGGLFLGGANENNVVGEGQWGRVYKFNKSISDAEFLALAADPQDLLVDDVDRVVPYVQIRYRTFEDRDLATITYVDDEIAEVVLGSGFATTDYVNDEVATVNTNWAAADTAGDAASVTSANNYTNTQLNSYSNTTQMNTAISTAVTNSHTDRIMVDLPPGDSAKVTLVGGWTYNLTKTAWLNDRYLDFTGSGLITVNANGFGVNATRDYSLIYTNSSDSGIQVVWNDATLINQGANGTCLYTAAGSYTNQTFNNCHLEGGRTCLYVRGLSRLVFNNCILSKSNSTSYNAIYIDSPDTTGRSSLAMNGCTIQVSLGNPIPDATAMFFPKGKFEHISMVGCTIEFPYVYNESSSNYQWPIRFDDFAYAFQGGHACIISGLVIKQSNKIIRSNVVTVGEEGIKHWAGLTASDIKIQLQNLSYGVLWASEALNNQSIEIVKEPMYISPNASISV